MTFYNIPDAAHAQPAACTGLGGEALLIDPGQIFRFDALAGIADDDQQPLFVLFDLQRDRPQLLDRDRVCGFDGILALSLFER